MMHKVAVYGTLRKGESNSGLLRDSKFLGEDTVRGRLLDIGWFPGFLSLSPEEETREVKVELYEVDDATLQMLDYLEGYRESDLSSSLYLRFSVITMNGEVVWCYLWNGSEDTYPVVESGDWVQYTRQLEKGV